MLTNADVKLIQDTADVFIREGCHVVAALILEEADGIKQHGSPDKFLARQTAIQRRIAEKRIKESVCTTSPLVRQGDPRELLDGPIELAPEIGG